MIKISIFKKSKMADGRRFDKLPYLSNGLNDCHKLLQDDTQ